ncbi:MAG: hypothetical protein L0Y71_21120 [Gemmataceae bacterium]|nr:hypothetical protein [Gemmataceae bacterium]
MRKAILTLVCCLASIPAARSEERFYVVFFASQNSNNQAPQSHTFATFLRINAAEGSPNGGPDETSETATISWLPANGSIRILQGPVAGRNFTLSESLAWAQARGLRTTARGPFEINKQVYDRALQQKERLESGAIAYKMLDRRFRPNVATNCIHAVSDILPGPLVITGDARGDAATRTVAAHYRPYLVDSDRTHAWVMRRLNLEPRDVVFVNESGRRPATNGVGE